MQDDSGVVAGARGGLARRQLLKAIGLGAIGLAAAPLAGEVVNKVREASTESYCYGLRGQWDHQPLRPRDVHNLVALHRRDIGRMPADKRYEYRPPLRRIGAELEIHCDFPVALHDDLRVPEADRVLVLHVEMAPISVWDHAGVKFAPTRVAQSDLLHVGVGSLVSGSELWIHRPRGEPVALGKDDRPPSRRLNVTVAMSRDRGFLAVDDFVVLFQKDGGGLDTSPSDTSPSSPPTTRRYGQVLPGIRLPNPDEPMQLGVLSAKEARLRSWAMDVPDRLLDAVADGEDPRTMIGEVLQLEGHRDICRTRF